MIEKILERLEEAKFPITDLKDGVKVNGIQATDDAVLYAKAIEIVQEVAKEYGKDTNVRSNADRIRSMNDEELAEFLCGVYDEDECNGKYICGVTIANYEPYNILEWLKLEVDA